MPAFTPATTAVGADAVQYRPGSAVYHAVTDQESCAIDPIPTFLLKELVDPLLAYVTAMISASLRKGYLPAEQKRTVVTPLLKKPGLDADELRHYRPVFNLTFVSKLVERVVTLRLVGYLNSHGLMPQLVCIPPPSQYRDCTAECTVGHLCTSRQSAGGTARITRPQCSV